MSEIIRIGTDCSGIEAPIQALRNINIYFSHEFSSDIDRYCIDSIRANYTPKKIFTDITKRNIKEVPDIDLYVCGFPCQPFSLAGNKKGTKDKRGKIFYSCLEVIKYKKPKYFLMENVKGLVTIENGIFFNNILKLLQDLKIYDVYWKVLNTKDYGIPQNRERLYIIGIRKNLRKTFNWPTPVKMKNLISFIDKNDTQKKVVPNFIKESNMLKNIPKNSLVVDFSYPKCRYINSDKICPCITTTCNNLWCIPLKRYLNIEELLKLQGFPKNFKQVVSDTQMKKQIGNSMSVCVLENIFKKLLN